jgi:hypothetical protein
MRNDMEIDIKEPQIMAPRVTPLEGVSTYAMRGIGVRGVENPQGFSIDERRFVNLNIQRFSEFYQGNSRIKSPQSTQRSQSFSIPATAYETAPPSRRGTRMTRIARIFTDPCASASSAQSAFHRHLSAFICVHLRLIFDRKMNEALAAA